MNKPMEGQYTDNEFKEMMKNAGILRASVNYHNGTAFIRYGKYTTNYYIKHSDNSWTNTNCKTSM